MNALSNILPSSSSSFSFYFYFICICHNVIWTKFKSTQLSYHLNIYSYIHNVIISFSRFHCTHKLSFFSSDSIASIHGELNKMSERLKQIIQSLNIRENPMMNSRISRLNPFTKLISQNFLCCFEFLFHFFLPFSHFWCICAQDKMWWRKKKRTVNFLFTRKKSTFYAIHEQQIYLSTFEGKNMKWNKKNVYANIIVYFSIDCDKQLKLQGQNVPLALTHTQIQNDKNKIHQNAKNKNQLPKTAVAAVETSTTAIVIW